MIVHSLLKYKFQLMGMIAFMIISFISMGIIFSHKNKASESSDVFREKFISDDKGTKHFFTVWEDLSDEEFHEYMNDDGTMYNKLKAFQNVLLEQKDFKYIPYSSQPLEVKGDFTDPIFAYGYEYGDDVFNFQEYIEQYNNSGMYAVKARSVPNSFFEEFSMDIDDGDMYKDDDGYIEPGKKIPIVLGKAYKGYYDIGDNITAHYAGSEELYTFEVKGFLKPNSFFYSVTNRDFVSCERYIFLPNIHINNLSKDERANLLLQFYGIIDSNLSFSDLEKRFNDLKKQCGLKTGNLYVQDIQLPESEEFGDFILESDAPPILQQYALMTDAISEQYAIIAFIVLGFGFSTMILLMCGVVRDSFYRFGVQMLCGASRGIINRQVTAMDAIPVFIADAAATITLMVMGADLRSILILQLITGIVITVSSIILIFYLNKLNIQKIIGKE